MSLTIQILGSNSASFAHNRHHTSQIVRIQGHTFMVDCGEGTQLQCKKFGIKISKIDHILISHLHGDHYLGLMGLLSTMHLYGRQKVLKLIAPPGLSEILALQMRHSQTNLNYPIDYVEWRPNESLVVFENDKFIIRTLPLNHRVPCSGYLFQEKEKRRRINSKAVSERLSPQEVYHLKNGDDVINLDGSVKYANHDVTLPPLPPLSYAYCSDTSYKPELKEWLEGVDMMYHEATFMSDMESRAESTFHSTAQQAATLARDAGIGRLIIGHFSTRYKRLDSLLEEARTTFPKTELALEGTRFEVMAP